MAIAMVTAFPHCATNVPPTPCPHFFYLPPYDHYFLMYHTPSCYFPCLCCSRHLHQLTSTVCYLCSTLIDLSRYTTVAKVTSKDQSKLHSMYQPRPPPPSEQGSHIFSPSCTSATPLPRRRNATPNASTCITYTLASLPSLDTIQPAYWLRKRTPFPYHLPSSSSFLTPRTHNHVDPQR